MNSHLTFSFPFILTAVLALLMFGLNYVVVPPTTAQNDALFNQPDYIVENLSGIQMNHESAIQHVFSAEKMLHYLDDDITYLERPYFISHEPEKPVMRLTAVQAELQKGGENIYLTENVTVLRGDDEDEDKITMVTSFLHLMPDDDIARTDKAVSIMMKNSTMNAVGLELDNSTGVLQLLSRVRAVED